jgi:nucleoside-diphosphate-sugar epimerase
VNRDQPKAARGGGASQTVCVAGASGLVGSNIVKTCLARGWTVHGTMRDPADPTKAPFLQSLPGAGERLRLFPAEMDDEGSFDAAVDGVDGVFIACLIPTYFGPGGKPAKEMDDEQGYAKIIMPTVNGCLNILRSALRRDVRTVVICSSTSSTNPVPCPAVKNEVDHWSDEREQCRAKKYTSATKTVMEKAAFQFAGQNHMRMSVFHPSMIVGPVVMPGHIHEGLQKLVRGEMWHEKIPNGSMSMIDVRDLAALHVAAFDNPEACGRYFGVYDSWHWADIYAALHEILPDMKMPAPSEGERVPATGFDHTRKEGLGVPLRDIPTILREAVEWIRTDPFPART